MAIKVAQDLPYINDNTSVIWVYIFHFLTPGLSIKLMSFASTLSFSTFVSEHEPCQCISNSRRRRLMIPTLYGILLNSPIYNKHTGTRLQAPSMARLAPALDLIQSRAYDAPHSEWQKSSRKDSSTRSTWSDTS